MRRVEPAPFSRADAYRERLHAPLDPEELARIRRYLAQEKALGEPRFQAMVDKALNRTTVVTPGGRPRRALAAD